MDIEQGLRQAIENSGMTLSELSRLTGIHRGVLSRFMRDERSPTLKTASPLFEVLGLRLIHTSRKTRTRKAESNK